MDPNSTISRMNPGRLFEQFYNASARDTHLRICTALGIETYTNYDHALAHIQGVDSKVVENQFEYLVNFYKIISPKMYNEIKTKDKVDWLANIVACGIAIYLPTDNLPESEDIVQSLQKHYTPVYGPVKYRGNSGREVTTKAPVRIAGVYLILLEKTGDDWSAVSSSKLQHHGVPSQLTKADKFAKPARNQAVRGSGEAEVRILASYVGSEFVAEIMDRNGSPQTHKHMVQEILTAKKPTNIKNLVDRKAIPFGGSKPLQLINHIAQCAGFEFTYNNYKNQHAQTA